MARFEYAITPVPTAEGGGTVEAIAALDHAMLATLSSYGQQGFCYVGEVESVTYEKPGCLAALFGAAPIPRSRRYMVFQRAWS